MQSIKSSTIQTSRKLQASAINKSKNQINNKLSKHLKSVLKRLLHFFFKRLTFTLQTEKLKKLLCFIKLVNQNILVARYRTLSFKSYHSNFLIRLQLTALATGKNQTRNSPSNKIVKKNRSTNDNLFILFETIKYGSHKGHFTTRTFFVVVVEKAFDQAQFGGLLHSLTTNGLNRKFFRCISNFFYQIKLIISINNQLSETVTPFYSVAQVSFLLYVSDMPQTIGVQMNLSKSSKPLNFRLCTRYL